MPTYEGGTTRSGANVTIDWKELSAKLPCNKTAKEKQHRRRIFNQMDMNGNNYLSLAEVDKGVRDILKADDLFNCKPAMLRAFNAVKDTAPAHTPHSDDYVTRAEFRLLLCALRQYFELFLMFDMIDTGDDRRVDINEFKAAIPKLAAWGVNVEDPEEEFKKIDIGTTAKYKGALKNAGAGGGQIDFAEFCQWAITKGLDLEDDDD
eukprot:TRINITY_DN709_c0_g1_i3.p1 TRINITY_DN709_c0_g1~~TRINITY_DN709_c0_g1_i3.p1  ORF type:complete len:206 (+),score=109.57 TRINITY_DN709_c0_g1_i3:87-704(+)